MKRKSLVLYASMTGNTEKVAMRFKHVLDKNGWECDIFKVDRHNFDKCPYKLDDYDLLCVGSPIMAGVPAKEIFEDRFGILMPTRLLKEPKFPKITEGYGSKKGIVFVTYAGNRRGPMESLPALDCLELRLGDLRVKCIGKFACPGKEFTHTAVDRIAEKKNWTVEEVSDAILRYKENPKHPDFISLSKEDHKLFAQATESIKETIDTRDRSMTWHWATEKRPSERDLLKAEIFLTEVLEDYYEGGIDAAPLSQYICIA